jgi:hypothetical protein
MTPQQGVLAVRHARRLWNDETRVGTYAAIVLVTIFVGWPLWRLWRRR